MINQESIVRHLYDVDAFEVIDKFKSELHLQDLPNQDIERIEKRIQLFEEVMVENMQDRESNIKMYQRQRHFIIPSFYNEYNDLLSLKLLVIDPYRIPAFLTYQSILFLGNEYAVKSNFIGLIEFDIYERVIKHDFKNLDIRRSKILEWVDKNRYFDFSDNTEARKESGFLISDSKFSYILFDRLKSIVEDSSQSDLFRLLTENLTPKTKIPVHTRVGSLVELFKRVRYNGRSFLNNEGMQTVLCSSFCIADEEMNTTELNPITVTDVLRRTAKEPNMRLFEEIAPYKEKEKRD